MNIALEKETGVVVSYIKAEAKAFPQIAKLWVFGSRLKRTNEPDSDLDIAIELIKVPKELRNLYGDDFGYWMASREKISVKFRTVCPWPLDLQWYAGDTLTGNLHEYLRECSELIYEKS